MPSTYDPLLRLELQATGENATTWGTKTNNNLELIAAAIAGIATVSVSSGDTTLSTANAATDQARSAILLLQGTLTGDVNVIVPSEPKTYAIIRGTSGAYNITVKNAGTGAVLPTTGNELIICTSATCYGLVSPLNATVSALDTRIAAVSASVSALNIQLAAVSTALTSTNNVVSALEVRVSAVSAAAGGVQAQVNAVSALVSALDLRVAAVSASVSALQVQLNNVSAALTSANNVVSALEVRVSTVSAQVSSLNALNIRIIE